MELEEKRKGDEPGEGRVTSIGDRPFSNPNYSTPLRHNI